MLFTLPIAGISSFIQNYFGLQTITILAFLLLVTLELVTGITAAKISGKKIESKKFGRFGLKIFVWVTLLFILNSLRLEYKGHEDTLGDIAYFLFSWIHGTLFIYINLEYLISVLENWGVISGKDNKSLIEAIKNKITGFLTKKK
jgi:hypothetical protein